MIHKYPCHVVERRENVIGAGRHQLISYLLVPFHVCRYLIVPLLRSSTLHTPNHIPIQFPIRSILIGSDPIILMQLVIDSLTTYSIYRSNKSKYVPVNTNIDVCFFIFNTRTKLDVNTSLNDRHTSPFFIVFLPIQFHYIAHLCTYHLTLASSFTHFSNSTHSFPP